MQGGTGNPDDAVDLPASDDATDAVAGDAATAADSGDVEEVDFWEATDPAAGAAAEVAPSEVTASAADIAAPFSAPVEPELVSATTPAEPTPPVEPAVPPAPSGPALPRHAAAPSPPVAVVTQQPQRGAETWYRTDQDRYKSVHRRANPWYRRLARGLIGLSFVAAAGVGLYFGAKVVQDYLDREKLPDQGVEIPDVRSTTIQFSSAAPAPQVNGTLTLDTSSRAFEFIGTGAQAGTQVVSPDGTTLYVRRGSGNWRNANASDTDVAALRRAIGYVADDDSADDILTSHLRRGYVDLEKRTEIGEGSDQLRQYELTLDTRGFDLNFPLQYRQFQDNALPNIDEVRAHPVNIWLDDDDVLVRVVDLRTMWAWERLAYSDQPFTPQNPADSLLDQTIEITDGTLTSDG